MWEGDTAIYRLFNVFSVATGSPDMCHRPSADNYVQITESEGYIASLMTQEIGYGSAGCPWYITVGSGQKIDLTLMDFNNRGGSSATDNTGRQGETDTCPLGLVIEEVRKLRCVMLQLNFM